TSSSEKSDSCGKPTGRAARVMRRFVGMRLASQFVRLGFYMGYAPPGTNPLELIALAQEAERLGYDSAWAAEAWGTDAVSVLSWLAATTTRIKVGSAIMQIPGRTPANTAMTAATLDLLSGGRFLLGLGTSGPQVVEGWHGEPWGRPLAKTREYVELVRKTLRRDCARARDRRRAGRTRRVQALLCALHRRDGRTREELLQRPLRALRLRSRGSRDSGSLPEWAQTRRGRESPGRVRR